MTAAGPVGAGAGVSESYSFPCLLDKIVIKDQVVQVPVIYPDYKYLASVQELAEKAWRSVNKEITIARMTVKVRVFKR